MAYHGSGWESGNKESEDGLQREENASYARGRTANPIHCRNVQKKQRWREEVLSRKLPNIKGEIGIRKILTVKNTTEQRNLGNLAYKIKCKWENQAKKRELKLDGEQELDRI